MTDKTMNSRLHKRSQYNLKLLANNKSYLHNRQGAMRREWDIGEDPCGETSSPSLARQWLTVTIFFEPISLIKALSKLFSSISSYSVGLFSPLCSATVTSAFSLELGSLETE